MNEIDDFFVGILDPDPLESTTFHSAENVGRRTLLFISFSETCIKRTPY